MSTTRPTESEQPLEWEGGDPPCWAHLFADDEPPLPERGELTPPVAAVPTPASPAPLEPSS